MYLLSKIHKTPIGNTAITVKTFVAKNDGYRMGQKKQKTFRRQHVISFLDLINLTATTRL